MDSILPTQRPGKAASPAERLYLALFLPRWPTDCYKRLYPALAASARPLVFYEKQGSALRLVATDARASGRGLMPGQSLSEARALVPDLDAREMDHNRMAEIFADFADWHSYASPIVSILTDILPFGDLVLDVTGIGHLFGGEENLLSRVLGRLRGLNYAVSGAIAPNVGTAWALAHFAGPQVLAGDTATALAGLPVAALRLGAQEIETLHMLGLKRIGQLYGFGRKTLQERFGLSLLKRLDQALGRLEERPRPRLPVPERYSECRFAEPLSLLDSVLAALEDAACNLSRQLERDGLGAQSFHLFLYRVDHKVMTLTVRASRATRDPRHIVRLFRNRAERLADAFDAGFGIDMLRLAAMTVSRLDPTQIGAFEHRDGAEDIDRLHDRMLSRLGAEAVLRIVLADTHVPERAAQLRPVLDHPPAAAGTPLDPDLPRPLRLFPDPEPIKVTAAVPDGPPANMVWRRLAYRFVKASGPERIGSEWWLSAFKLSDRKRVRMPPDKSGRREEKDVFERYRIPDRDYYLAEDADGHRFWLFRQDHYGDTDYPVWFLHGVFS